MSISCRPSFLSLSLLAILPFASLSPPSSSLFFSSPFVGVFADYYEYDNIAIKPEVYVTGRGLYEMYAEQDAPWSIWKSESIQPNNPMEPLETEETNSEGGEAGGESASGSGSGSGSGDGGGVKPEEPKRAERQRMGLMKWKLLDTSEEVASSPDVPSSDKPAESKSNSPDIAATASSSQPAQTESKSTDESSKASATPSSTSPSASSSSSSSYRPVSYIALDLQFTTVSQQPSQSFVEVHILQATNVSAIGFEQDHRTSICCTSNAIEHNLCKTPGTLFISDHDRSEYAVRSFRAEFKGSPVARLSGPDAVYPILQTGEHLVIISNCDPDSLADGVVVSGSTEWMNPYGYLSGRLYGFLPFYGVMTVIYSIVGLIWLVLIAFYWNEVAAVQHCITAVVGMCILECAVWFLDYKNWNDTGRRHMGVIVVAILLTVVRLSISRMLAVSVSLGWGVVRPSLGKNGPRLIVLGVLYFLSESAWEIAVRYAQSNHEIAEKWRVTLALPVALLNSIFYWWIFLSLNRLLAYLDARKQSAKLVIYRHFTLVLLLSLMTAVIYALYQIYFTLTQQQLIHWSNIWLLDQGMPLIIYSIILFSIAFLWRPSSSSRAYAYTQVGTHISGSSMTGPGEEDDEFGELEMGAVGGKRGAGDGDGDGGGLEFGDDGHGGSEDEDESGGVGGGLEPVFAIEDEENSEFGNPTQKTT